MWPKQIIQGQNEANRKHLCFVSMVQHYYPTDEKINSIKLNENFLVKCKGGVKKNKVIIITFGSDPTLHPPPLTVIIRFLANRLIFEHFSL